MPSARIPFHRWITLVFLAGLAWLPLAARTVGGDGLMTRGIPAEVLAGTAFQLSVTSAPASHVAVHAVEDSVPAGWNATQISHGGRLDTNTHRIKWGPYFDATSRILTARITPPPEAGGRIHIFQGTASLDGRPMSIDGASALRVLSPAGGSRAKRTLPASYQPGVPLTVALEVRPASTVGAWSLQEAVPAGWTLSDPNHGGVLDPQTGQLKWGPFTDAAIRTLTYTLLPPIGSVSEGVFSGTAAFDRETVPVEGASRIAASGGSVIRTLPSAFRPGQTFTVSLSAIPAPAAQAYAVAETVPIGWQVAAADTGAAVSPDGRTVRWGPFFDAVPRTLTYSVIPGPSGGSFDGVGSFDGITQPAAGSRTLVVGVGSVVRQLPNTFRPGMAVEAAWEVSPAAGTSAYAVEDRIPAGWTLIGATDGGVLDASGVLRWGPFLDDQSRRLSAILMPPSDTVVRGFFLGRAAFDLDPVEIMGVQGVELERFDSVVTRQLPPTHRSGSPLWVTHGIEPAPGVAVYAFEERLPVGVVPSAISHGGVWDERNHRVKWGPFLDRDLRELAYRLDPDPSAAGEWRFEAQAVFDGNAPLPADGPDRVTLLPNSAPRPLEDSFQRPADSGLIIAVATLLANDTDPNGDLLELDGFDATGESGGTLALTNATLVYSPPPASAVPDRFRYRVRDGFGGTAEAVVTVGLAPTGPGRNLLGIRAVAEGLEIRFLGIPGRQYAVQTTSNLLGGEWTTQATLRAGTSGQILFVDTSGEPGRFYRTAQP